MTYIILDIEKEQMLFEKERMKNKVKRRVLLKLLNLLIPKQRKAQLNQHFHC